VGHLYKNLGQQATCQAFNKPERPRGAQMARGRRAAQERCCARGRAEEEEEYKKY
jgi:hypothetical protein